MNKTLLRLVAAAAFTVATASSYAEVNTYRAHGTVESIGANNDNVTLVQDAVTDLGWPTRTMTYRVDGNNVLDGIQIGQTVDVTFTTTTPYQASAHFVTPVSQ